VSTPLGDPPVTVFAAQGEIEARAVLGLLESHGITAIFKDEAVRQVYGFTLDGLGRVEIQVLPTQVEKAREIIEKMERGELALPDTDDDDTDPPAPSS
jgi:hypothetical protein